MIEQHIHQLKQTEKLSGISLEAVQEKLPYKHFNQVWIRSDRPIKDIDTRSLKHSELQFYPNTNYKAWSVLLLTGLKLRKSGQKFSKLLGIGLDWTFTKPVYLPLQADVIYYRHHAVIMVYTSPNQKKVIKVALTNWGNILMKSEVESQRLASSIVSKDIFIPSIIQEFHKDGIDFTVEDYFEGKKQSFKDKNQLEANYHSVFQFLLKFYLSNPIELQYLSESKFLNHGFVEDFIQNQEDGVEVVSIYKTLYAKERKMILCRIHGDLNHNNVLSDKDTVCIIDWGKSKFHYLARDLECSSYETPLKFILSLLEELKSIRNKFTHIKSNYFYDGLLK